MKAVKPTSARPRRLRSVAVNTRVRIDAHGYARIVRPMRSSQAIDPVSNVVDGAADMERDAALTVCSHLNEHVESLAFPHRWTPSPDQVLLPVAARAFTEQQPKPPKASISTDPRVKAAADPQDMNDYLDARAAWLARRLAWDAAQRSIHQLKEKAESGDLDAMQRVFAEVPARRTLAVADHHQLRVQRPERSQSLNSSCPALTRYRTAKLRWRAATGSRSGACQTSRTRSLHNQHALGLVVRLLGELFASLPTIETVTVSALQVAAQRQTAALHRVCTGRALPMVIAALERRGYRRPGNSLPESATRALQSDRTRRVHRGRAVQLMIS